MKGSLLILIVCLASLALVSSDFIREKAIQAELGEVSRDAALAMAKTKNKEDSENSRLLQEPSAQEPVTCPFFCSKDNKDCEECVCKEGTCAFCFTEEED